MQQTSGMTELDRVLIERMQQDVPLVPRPFAAIAADIGSTYEA